MLPLSPLPAQRRLTPPRNGAGCKVNIWAQELKLLCSKNEKLAVETEYDEIQF